MKSLIPVLFIALMLASGCEKSITINLPEQPRKLVLNAVMLRGETIHASLTRTLSNAESGKGVNVSVAGAQVLLYRDGQLADTLKMTSPGEYQSQTAAVPGHRYKLVVSHPSYAAIEAETDSPEAVPILEWQHTPLVRSNPDKGDQDLLRIRFRDPAASGDYYIIQVLDANSSISGNGPPLDFYSWDYCISPSDPSLESPYTSEFPGEDACLPSRSMFLRDILFNGQEKDLRLYVPSNMLIPYYIMPGSDTAYATLRLYHVTPDFYRFVKSYRSADDVSGNPFAEPFNVASNVRGGYGVFAILSEDKFEVR